MFAGRIHGIWKLGGEVNQTKKTKPYESRNELGFVDMRRDFLDVNGWWAGIALPQCRLFRFVVHLYSNPIEFDFNNLRVAAQSNLIHFLGG